MADNVTLPGTDKIVATDDIGDVHFQRVKLDLGADGVSEPVVGALPVSGPLTDAQVRATPLPVMISDGSGPITVDGTVAVSGSVPVTGAFWQATQPVSGPLTDAQVRAAPLPISGLVAVSNLPGTQPVSGSVSVSNLPATQAVSGSVAVNNFPGTQVVSGPVTDAQIRATPLPISGSVTISDGSGPLTVDGTVAISGTVPVSGPLTDAQLRGAAVPVSALTLPLPTGAATQASLALVATAGGAPADAEASGDGSIIALLKRLRTLLSNSLTVTGPATDAQLRATPLPISGTVTVTDGSGPITVDGTVDVSGPVAVTGSFWQTTQPVSGPLTNDEMRAAPLPVSGPLTDTEIRATALPVSGTVSVGNFPGTQAVTGAFWQTNQPVSGPLTNAELRATAISTSEPATVLVGQAAQTATVNNILEAASGAAGTAVENLRAASVQVVSTGTGGGFIFEQSNDNVNWIALPVFNAALTTGVPIVAAIVPTASAIIYSFPIRGRFIRLRISTAITGGSIQAVSRLSPDPWLPSVMTVAQPTAASLQATVAGTVTANIGTGSLAAGVNRIAFTAASGIWYDDSSTVLAGAAVFTGASRDATATVTATSFNSAVTFAKEVRACAESDQTGTMWLEASRDNTNWRRIRSVATVAVAGGGFAADLIYAPSWRYWRIGFTNGATLQTRFTIGTVAMAV